MSAVGRAPAATGPGREALSALAARRLARVQDHPEARYQLRRQFYRKYGFGIFGTAGYGTAELAFMRWQIARGLFNPLDHPHAPGSPYWRTTNGKIGYCAELAALVHERGATRADVPGIDVVDRSPEVRAWLAFLANPSPRTWYRAHTLSLVRAMIEHRAEARQEQRAEQRFINQSLYWLLCAETMVMGASFGMLGRIAADPRAPGVGFIVQFPALYPRHYPLGHRGRDGDDTAPDDRGQVCSTSGVSPIHGVPGRSRGSRGSRLGTRLIEVALDRVVNRAPVMVDLIRLYLYPMVAGRLDFTQLVYLVQQGHPIYPDFAPTGPDQTAGSDPW